MKGKESKPHIGIFGRRNSGKSALINAITGQEIAIVSDIAGTTTDPVKKAIEIKGIGPVILIDTAGIDDFGELGMKRVAKTDEALEVIDLAIIVINEYQWSEPEEVLAKKLIKLEVPFLIINNKIDIFQGEPKNKIGEQKLLNVSTVTKEGINELVQQIIALMPSSLHTTPSLLDDIVHAGDTILLITPIDEAAPEKRLILPQVQMIRDILDHDAIAIVLKVDKITHYLRNHPAPQLIITDSQVFDEVSSLIPPTIPLTSFSIILARQKGNFAQYLKGTPFIEKLKDNDEILILESCTHLTSCEDIGRVKIPNWLQSYTKKKLQFTFVSGLEKLPDISKFAMVVQCGGCMVTRKQLHNRLNKAIALQIPITNYGMLIAYVNGIFERAIQPFQK